MFNPIGMRTRCYLVRKTGLWPVFSCHRRQKRQCQPEGWHWRTHTEDQSAVFCMWTTRWGKGISMPSASKVSFTFSWKSNQTPQ